MSFAITATMQVPASPAVHAARDREAALLEEGKFLDLMSIKEVVAELEQGTARARSQLDAKVAKAGLKSHRPNDMQYGCHGNNTGPIEFWYQRYYAG